MSDQPLEKVYSPETVEKKWMARWEKEAISHASAESNRPPFSMVIPPPNVTGSLHLGHALNNTLQDILARWKRMSGFNVLWLPGLDHAGIATQNVVERRLDKAGEKNRHKLGRDAFIARVKEWKEESGGTILKQLRHLGSSCDWARERFTMDEGLSRAVNTVFIRLYKEGLIYRDQRLINLCPHCRTALSDIEVEHEEIEGKMYYIKYPLTDDPQQYLTVATTRPETLLGDTAVAVHPEDPRFNHLIGKTIKLPLTGREIPIIGDPILVDREKGTGAVKITPGHDFNDEKSGKRHGLEKISLIDWSGKMSPWALQKEAQVNPDLVKSLSCKTMSESRKIVVKSLEEAALLTKVEKNMMSLGKCYRCKSVVEPFDSPQWFVKVDAPGNSLAQAAVDAVREKKIRLIPESWEANYFGWMENIEDWCISRQIWWGHQVPVFYCKDCDRQHILEVPDSDEIIIASEATPIVAENTCPKCGGNHLVQDPDVLDTWFSSALWPFSTLGWPADQQTNDAERIEAEALLARFYPTSTLVSAFDILFFWIARMIMMGLHFMKDIPFKDVYIHALVRDADGQKMSKSKGNVIDPLDIMEHYGTDALRFTLAAMASPGRDIKLSEDRIEGYRNFCNKIWNAARFIQMNRPETKTEPQNDSESNRQSIIHRWIQSRLNQTVTNIITALEHYRYDEAARAAYQFTWHTFCDWYLELLKVDFQQKDRALAAYRQLVETFEESLRLLHPFMPFLTEELWAHFGTAKHCLALAAYPKPDAKRNDPEAEELVEELINGSIIAIRNLRGEMNIPPSEVLPLMIKPADEARRKQFEEHIAYIKRLARLGKVTIDCDLSQPKRAASAGNACCEIYLPLDEARVRNEIGRIDKRLGKLEHTLKAIKGKLNNAKFVKNAPETIVEKNRQEALELDEKKLKFEADLQNLHKLLAD